MRSHEYDFHPSDLLPIIGWPLVPVVLFALLMHGGAALKVLPKPRPTVDVDRTILIHQAEASAERSGAQVLLVGDSSCLMDVSAVELSRSLSRPVLNLGTLSFLDLSDYAQLLRRFAAANPGQVKTVVLLMHPEALRRAPGGTYHPKFFRAFIEGEDYIEPITLRDRVSNALGLEKFRARLFARAVPAALPGNYGRRFGFSRDLDRFLTENGGSTIELDRKKFDGSPEYRLGKQLENASRTFRAAVPPGAKLAVGITPAPAGYVQRNYSQTSGNMLDQWAKWLQADIVLSNLPPVMADENFARTTHLTEKGAEGYTRLLGRELRFN